MNDTYRITTLLNDGKADAPAFIIQGDRDELIWAIEDELDTDKRYAALPVGATILIERIA